MASHHQVEMSHGRLQQEEAALRLGLVWAWSWLRWVPLTDWWLVLLALQLVKLVQVLLLSGWRPHSPFSAHTLNATAGNTFEGHEGKVGLSGAARSSLDQELASLTLVGQRRRTRPVDLSFYFQRSAVSEQYLYLG